MKSFPELLEIYRRERNISKKNLATLAGLTPGYISLLTRGERTAPSEETVRALARALELDTEARIDFFLAAGYSASPLNDESLLAVNRPGIDGQGREPVGVYRDEIPDVENFFGRQKEMTALEHWIVDGLCRVVAIEGIGGIGKTSIAASLVKRFKSRFDYVFWRTLQHAPSLDHILRNCIQLLSNQRHIDLPENTNELIALLIKYLQTSRCLLVLDNVESILQGGHHAGQYREGFEGYGKLVELIGTSTHQSCLLLTSREKLKEVSRLEGTYVRSLQITGVTRVEGREILNDKGLFGSDEAWATLIDVYSGNPLALKLVSAPIRQVFGGDIAEFLREGGTIINDIQNLLEEHFTRLSEREQEVMYWLAIEREAVSLNDLRENITFPLTKGTLLETLDSLRGRAMVELSGSASFTLQPVIMEYVSERFLEKVYTEIEAEDFKLFGSIALIKAQAKDYIRNSQIRFILQPLVERLVTTLGKEESERKLKRILSALQAARPQTPEYTAGNVLNLLIQMKASIRGCDFSNLIVWQAFLQGAELPEVDFSHTNLAKSVFTETFGSILAIAVSSREHLLAGGTVNCDIRIWHDDGTPLVTCQGHTDWVRSVAFGLDDTVLVSGSDDQTVRFWDTHTGQNLKTLQGHKGRVYSVTCSPANSSIASGSEDQTVRIWDARTGECLRILPGHTGTIRSVAFSPDGSMIASGSADQSIRLWDARTAKNLKTLQGHIDGIGSIAFSPEGRMLASGSEDQTIRLWDTHTGQCLQTLQGHIDSVRSVTFSRDGRMLVSSSEDQTIRLWDTHTGQCFKTLQGHTSFVWSVAFSPDGRMLASGSEDQAVHLWDTHTGQCFKTLQGHTDWIRAVAFSPDGRILASGGEDQAVRLWEVTTGQCLKILQGHTGKIRSIAFSPEGRMLASGSEDQTIRLWEANTGQCLQTLQGHTSRIWSVAFSPAGNIIASGSGDNTVRLWSPTTGQCLKILQGHTSWVSSVAFNVDGTVLVSSSDDQTIQLWDTSAGQHLETLPGKGGRVYSVAFSPDGSMLASGSYDQLVRLWNLSTNQPVQNLSGHTNWVWSIAFSPAGDIIASGSGDGTIKLWDLRTGQCLKTLRNPRPYEGMNITDVRGLSIAQKAMLKTLGAVEY